MSILPLEYEKLLPIYNDEISKYFQTMNVQIPSFNTKNTNITKEEFSFQIKITISLPKNIIELVEEDDGHISYLIYEANIKNMNAELLTYINLYEDSYYQIYIETDQTSLIINIILPIIARSLSKKDLDKISFEYNWDISPLDRTIGDKKVQKYITTHLLKNKLKPDNRFEPIVEEILRNTVYVNYETFKKELLIVVDRLPEKFNICFFNELLFPGKVGSEHWIVIILWPYIRHKVINLIYSFEIEM